MSGVTVAELVAILANLPQDAPVFVDAEGGWVEPAEGVALDDGRVVVAAFMSNYPADAGVSR